MLLENIKSIVWGFPTVLLVVFAGAFFTVKSRLYRPSAVAGALKTVFRSFGSKKSGNGISPFAAAATALGGTVGVGSIVGVGYGIAVGGAGSVFWMWVCSFFGMGLKYAEVKISLRDRSEIGGRLYGGAPYRLKKLGYKRLSALFCLTCVACSFGTGNLAQSGAIASFLASVGIPPWISALICGLLVAFAAFGGGKRISSLNAVIVPAASAIYIIACLLILIFNRTGIPQAFASIFTQALGIRPALGGFSGALLAHSIKEGCARSVFSNEAGMGSSPLAHATADAEGGDALQCSFGVFEIFFDTFVVSTLTALCLLSAGTDDPQELFSGSFGSFGGIVFGLLVAVFAFASVISWCYYAECCIFCLFGDRKAPGIIYRVLFSAAACLGAFSTVGGVMAISDILNALMLFPNLFLLFKCRSEIINEVN